MYSRDGEFFLRCLVSLTDLYVNRFEPLFYFIIIDCCTQMQRCGTSTISTTDITWTDTWPTEFSRSDMLLEHFLPDAKKQKLMYFIFLQIIIYVTKKHKWVLKSIYFFLYLGNFAHLFFLSCYIYLANSPNKDF